MSVFDPPLNVGVEPTVSPEDDSIVTLCASGALFVKSIDTLPDFALNDFASNASWPSGFAARLSFALAPAADGVELVVCVELLVVGASAGVLLDDELAEPPQPASATSVAASASAEIA